MVKIDQFLEKIVIPKHTNPESTSFRLEFYNKFTGIKYTLFDLVSTGSELLYEFEVEHNTYPVGEYDYKLYDENDNIIEIGLAVYGDYRAEHKEYEPELNSIAYEPEN